MSRSSALLGVLLLVLSACGVTPREVTAAPAQPVTLAPDATLISRAAVVLGPELEAFMERWNQGDARLTCVNLGTDPTLCADESTVGGVSAQLPDGRSLVLVLDSSSSLTSLEIDDGASGQVVWSAVDGGRAAIGIGADASPCYRAQDADGTAVVEAC